MLMYREFGCNGFSTGTRHWRRGFEPLTVGDGPEDLRLPILRIGIVGRIGDIGFPRRSRRDETLGLDPYLNGGMSLRELVISAGVGRGRHQPARKRVPGYIAFAWHQRRHGHSGFHRYQPRPPFKVTGERLPGQRRARTLRILKDAAEHFRQRRRDLGRFHSPPHHQHRLREDFFLRDGVFHGVVSVTPLCVK
jgi:hypothetical protein